MLIRGKHPFGENFHRQVSTIFMLLSCVYYYMLTRGRHPFGENFHRPLSTIFMLLRQAGQAFLWG
jgi:hypothetical protein